MDLRADDSGFLIGAGRISLNLEKERLQLLRAIKADTAAMRKSLEEATPARVTRSAAPAANLTARAARVARAPANDAGPSLQQQQQEQQRSVSARRVRVAQEAQAERAATPQRGANGRFVSGGAGAGDQATAKSGQRKLLAGVGALLSSLKSGLGRMGGGGETVDPAIAAGREFGSLVSPLTKPFKGLAGLMFRGRRDDTEQKVAVPWYRRIWSELRGINQKSGGNGGRSLLSGIAGAIGGALAGLLGAVPGVGLLAKGASALMGGRRRRDAGDALPSRRERARERLAQRNARNGRGGNLFTRALKGAGGLGKGFLKRIPLLGALVSGGSALASIFGLGGGTKEERFKGAGGGIGALLGGAIGSLVGPVGTVIGGILGDLVGTKVGEWLSTVDWGKVGETITGAWDSVTSTMSEGWKWVQDKFGGTLDAISSTFSGIKDAASNLLGQAADWGKEKLTAAKDVVKGAVDKVAAATAPAVKAVKEKTGSLYEAATIEGGRLMGKLDKGYRHKENFDGIKGGASLAKYGTYTNEEAARIRELKSSGANTSGNLKGGMPQDIRNKIIAQATAAGLDPEQMLQIAALESGGNPNAISSTGATGVFQMTGQTATGLGITNRFDADQNIAGGMKLAQANAEQLRKKGLAVNRDNLYMMHQLGPKAATDIIQGAAQGKSLNELSAGTQTAASMNYGKDAKTAKEYLAKNSMALDARLGQVSKTVPATLAAVAPVSAAPKASTVPMLASAASSIDKQALAPVPTPPRKIADNSKKSETPSMMAAPLTQNIADRGLAQAATGGIGMNIGRR